MADQYEIIDDFVALAADYDALILDVWGVLFDGAELYEGIIDMLKLLRDRKQRVCLLSNSPHRAFGIVERLKGLGITRDLYDGIITSGESAHMALLKRDCPDHAALGHRYFGLMEERSDILCGLDVEQVERPEDADFVFNTALVHDVGSRPREKAMEMHGQTLQRCAELGLVMLCANPDLVVNVGAAYNACSGMFAEIYKQMGGSVIYHGKPYRPVYERVFDTLGCSAKDRVLAVGDGLHTDIAGANALGMDCLLVAGGIHRDVLDETGDLHSDRLAGLLQNSPHKPNYVAKGIGLHVT